MDVSESRLTVFFDDPFWIGIFERRENGKLSVAKTTFGAEPKDYEVYAFVLEKYITLRFSPTFMDKPRTIIHKNPKRTQRQAERLTHSHGVGTKAQQALKQQQEQRNIVKKARRHERTEAERQRQFDLKQQKRKEKRRGH